MAMVSIESRRSGVAGAGAGAGARAGLTTWAVGAAGAVAAVTLPLVRVGIGWLITGVAMIVAVAVVRRVSPGAARAAGRGDRLFRAAIGVAALALLSVAGIRAATWLVALCVVAAVALGSYALAGGAGWAALGRGMLTLPVAVVTTLARGLGALVGLGAWGGLGARGGPGAAARPGRRDGSSSAAPSGVRVIGGIVVGMALLIIFGTLFATADAEFGRRLREWTSGLTVGEGIRAAVALALTSAAVLAAARITPRPGPPAVRGDAKPGDANPGDANPGDPEPRRWDWLEWSVPLIMLDLLFGSFVYVQLTVFFAGDDYVLGPGGPTYAQHALRGFTTLMVVCLLTLGVFAGLARWAGRGSRGRRALLRVLGGGLGLLTLVVVASALRRMAVYVDAYGFTRIRLLADAFEVWLGLSFVLILVAGVRLRASWLPRAVLATGTAVLLGLAAINPDAYIARTVLDRYHKDQHLDAAYLATLSADAVPQINTLPDVYRSCILAYHTPPLHRPDPWYAWNAGRAGARAELVRKPRLELPNDADRPPWQMPPLVWAGAALQVCWG